MYTFVFCITTPFCYELTLVQHSADEEFKEHEFIEMTVERNGDTSITLCNYKAAKENCKDRLLILYHRTIVSTAMHLDLGLNSLQPKEAVEKQRTGKEQRRIVTLFAMGWKAFSGEKRPEKSPMGQLFNSPDPGT